MPRGDRLAWIGRLGLVLLSACAAPGMVGPADRCLARSAAGPQLSVSKLLGTYRLTLVATAGTHRDEGVTGTMWLWSTAADTAYARVRDSAQRAVQRARASGRQALYFAYEAPAFGATTADPLVLGAGRSTDPRSRALPAPGITARTDDGGHLVLGVGAPPPLTNDGQAVRMDATVADSTGIWGQWWEAHGGMAIPLHPASGYFCAVRMRDSASAT